MQPNTAVQGFLPFSNLSRIEVEVKTNTNGHIKVKGLPPHPNPQCDVSPALEVLLMWRHQYHRGFSMISLLAILDDKLYMDTL